MTEFETNVLKFMEAELQRHQNWTFIYEIEERFKVDISFAGQALEKLLALSYVKQCGCGCKGWVVAEKGFCYLRSIERPTVWVTQDGYKVRVSHMSDEHIVNAINWLLTDPHSDTTSDLDDKFLEIPISSWIRELTQELYRRLHPELVNG